MPLEALFRSAERRPNRTAYCDDRGDQVTFGAFLRRVKKTAAALQTEYGLKRGEICGILCGNTVAFCTAFYGILLAGGIALPVSIKLRTQELDSVLGDAGCRILLADRASQPAVDALPQGRKPETVLFLKDRTALGEYDSDDRRFDTIPEFSDEDGAMIVYTSGTTGRPKGAFITHGNIRSAAKAYEDILGLTDKDTTILATPIGNVTGIVGVLCTFMRIGGKVILHERFSAGRIIDTMCRENVTFLHGSPTVFIKLLEKKECGTPRTLKKGACGSANLPKGVITALHEWIPGFEMHPVFGMTETTSPLTIMPEDPLRIGKAGSSGLPIPGTKIVIRDAETGEALKKGSVGEVSVKGPTVISRYHGLSEEENGKYFRDGYLLTGDIGRVDEDGYLYILDRKKDMINRGGEKVYASEVEHPLSMYPGVLECSVTGIPDAVYGERVAAAIRLKNDDGIDESALRVYLKGRMASFKVPDFFVVMDEFPRNENGKIDKRLLRQRITERICK